MSRRVLLGVAGAIVVLAGAVRAEVIDSQPTGFAVREIATIAAPPTKVWGALVRPETWWSPDHTFSHDSAHLSLAPQAGGLWLERLPSGGGVEHLAVVYVDPPSLLRLEGALGPMQGLGAAGHLTFELKPEGEATVVTATYDIGGHAPGGLDRFTTAVDHVLGEQVGRLKAVVETGKSP